MLYNNSFALLHSQFRVYLNYGKDRRIRFLLQEKTDSIAWDILISNCNQSAFKALFKELGGGGNVFFFFYKAV